MIIHGSELAMKKQIKQKHFPLRSSIAATFCAEFTFVGRSGFFIMNHSHNFIDITGQRFSKWTVISFSHHVPGRGGATFWNCVCDCGTSGLVNGTSLRQGGSNSCGCLKTNSHGITHGATRNGTHTGAYRSWMAMKNRCLNHRNNRYHIYGGRGIKVCESWMSFKNFLADMGERPPGMTIERIETNGNYEPGNCRWATPKEQARNQRTNHIIEIKGVRKTVSEWTEIYGLNPKTVWSRIHYGFPEDERLFIPASSISRRNLIMITSNGDTRSIEQWSSLTGLDRGTILSRIRRGWTPERAVGTQPL